MQPDSSDNQLRGQVDQRPSSVQINQSANPTLIHQQSQGVTMVQPIQENIVYIKGPKFKHQSRVASTVLSIIGLSLAFITTSLGVIREDLDLVTLLAEGACCLSFNAAFICEIIFYSKMMEHNKMHNQSQGSAIANIVLLSILICLGFVLLFGILFGMLLV